MINLSEAGHSVLAFGPGPISSTATGLAATMAGAEHVSIYVLFGAEGGSPPTAPTSIQVNQCTDANGSNALPLAAGFRYYYQTAAGPGNDILDGNQQPLNNSVGPGPNYTSGWNGITTFPAGGGSVFLIEIDSPEVEISSQSVGSNTEHPYIQCVVSDTATPGTPCTILYVFTGLRYAYKDGRSFTT